VHCDRVNLKGSEAPKLNRKGLIEGLEHKCKSCAPKSLHQHAAPADAHMTAGYECGCQGGQLQPQGSHMGARKHRLRLIDSSSNIVAGSRLGHLMDRSAVSVNHDGVQMGVSRNTLFHCWMGRC
jgi:hypothetical protein